MPTNKGFKVALKDNGRYDLEGLTEQQFSQAVKQIQQKKARARRGASRTISPRLLRSKEQKGIDKLGDNADGMPITREDLIQLEKNRRAHEKKFGKQKAGIPLATIFAKSLDIDIKRANNQVDDRTGITRANMNSIKDNVVTYRVKASDKHGADAHAVEVRFEDWETFMHNAAPNTAGYRKATKRAVNGMISFDCTCERHQFWYRYLATTGNYALAPPKEFSPPKVRNPNFQGVACKHVLHVLNKVSAASWINVLAGHMERQASVVGGGSLRKQVIDDKTAKKQTHIRKSGIDVEKHRQQHKKYEERQRKLGQKLVADRKKIDRIRQNAQRARQVAMKAQNEALKQRKLAQQAANQNQKLIKMSFDFFKTANKGKKLSSQQLRKQFAKTMNLTEKQVGDALDG